MAIDHDRDPRAMPPEHGTDPNYPATLGERPSYGKLNYGPQMRAETDPNFLTPPGGLTASDAPPASGPISVNEPIANGPDSRGAPNARHQASARRLRAAKNDTEPMLEPVMLNETAPLADAFVAPEIAARRARRMRRDEATPLTAEGKKRIERRLFGAAAWGILAATVVIALAEFLFK